MSANPLPILQPPCRTCKSECCGVFPIGHRDVDRIRKYLATLPESERQRLMNQKRPMWTCLFVDVEHWRCSIYPVRPLVCQLYGKFPELTCTYFPQSSKECTHAEAKLQMYLDTSDQSYAGHTGSLDFTAPGQNKITSNGLALLGFGVIPDVLNPEFANELQWSDFL